MLFSSLLLLVASPLVQSSIIPAPDVHDHSHVERRALPGTWYQPRDHPVAALFKRDDGRPRPAVGSPEWAAPFPRGPLDANTPVPAAWVTALNNAKAAGRIPNIPPAAANGDANPIYPPGVNFVGPEVCSTTAKCRNPGDIWDAPAGVYASSFDDGPYPTSTELVDFLTAHNLHTTHFMIGINILNNPTQFLHAFEAGNDIAVHTWSHKHMTTLSDLQIVAELGWTMQIIHESTGGRVPRYWRPPYGDSDNRVRAIAKEVFGMDTVIWNMDSQDWRMDPASHNITAVTDLIRSFITGPKDAGLVILEHEINADYVRAFTETFPLIQQNGWRFVSLARAYGNSPYLNSASSTTSNVTVMDVGAPPAQSRSSSSSASTAPTSTPPSTTGSTPSTNSPGAQSSTTSSANSSAAVVSQCSMCLTAVASLLALIVGSLL